MDIDEMCGPEKSPGEKYTSNKNRLKYLETKYINSNIINIFEKHYASNINHSTRTLLKTRPKTDVTIF